MLTTHTTCTCIVLSCFDISVCINKRKSKKSGAAALPQSPVGELFTALPQTRAQNSTSMYTKLSMASNKTAHVKIGKKKAFPAVVRCVTDRYLNFVLPCKDNVIACCRIYARIKRAMEEKNLLRKMVYMIMNHKLLETRRKKHCIKYSVPKIILLMLIEC